MTGWRGRREKSGEIKSRPKVMKEENTTGLTLRLRSDERPRLQGGNGDMKSPLQAKSPV